MEGAKKVIDIRKIFREKNPALYNKLPNFFINYLRKVVHEDEVNRMLNIYKDEKGVDFCLAVMKHFNIALEAEGIENIPDSGGCVFAGNHPLGGMDALAIVAVLKDKRLDIKFLSNDILMNLTNLNTLFVGINKHGKNLKESLLKVDAAFQSDQIVCVFPAGLVSRKKGGVISDLEWKKTFITRAKKYQQPIIPVYVDGKLSNFFYRLSNIRTALGLKLNIEMLYLVDEMFRLKNSKIKIVFGEPIDPATFDKSKNDLHWANHVRQKVYQLGKKV